MTERDPETDKTEHDLKAADTTLSDGESTALSSSESAPSFQRPATRPNRRRGALRAIGMLMLLIVLFSGSVFAARVIIGSTSLAPEVSLLTTIKSGQQARASSASQTMQASCNCTSQHRAYASPPFQPSGAGQVVIVSLSKQQLWAYQNGRFVMTSLVTTGMPQLPTPTGTFHIMMKETNVWFYSPWPYGSPYYYSPEHINYAMLFRAGGFYIHDAPWRETFGPGTNVPHIEPDGKWATGSHGCVNMPTSTASQLYRWIGIGATVIIRN